MLEEWKEEILEYWNYGIMEFWNNGKRRTGRMESGMMEEIGRRRQNAGDRDRISRKQQYRRQKTPVK